MALFVTELRPRWSDMDAYGHVNHANAVTLLEEARVELLFAEAARHVGDSMAKGVVVAKLLVHYHQPLLADGSSVRVELSVRGLRAASFTIDYAIRPGRDPGAKPAVTAETLLVPYDVAGTRPRRLTDAERDFLAGWRVGGAAGGDERA